MLISMQLVVSTCLLNWNLKVRNETLLKSFKLRQRERERNCGVCTHARVCERERDETEIKERHLQGGLKEAMETN